MKKNKRSDRATAIVMRATTGNPISILNINKAHDFAEFVLNAPPVTPSQD